jgi:SAM-dependent methyltransferase
MAAAATICYMQLYQCDLAHIHAVAFESIARGAAGEIVARLERAHVSRVLDVGCGAGPLTKILVDAGFHVTGIDTSRHLLELARVNVPAAPFVHASVYDIDLRNYEAVVAVGEALTYHPEETDTDNLVHCFFQRVSQALPPGGLLIFDVIGLGEPTLAGRSWRSGADWAILVETTEDQSERRLVRSIETFRRVGNAYRRSHEIHHVRLFDIPALCARLVACGFSVETSSSYGAQQLPPRRRAFFATSKNPRTNWG